MKILILSTEFPPGPGGIGTHAFELASRLLERNHEVLVISCQDYSAKEDVKNFNLVQKFKIKTLPSGFMKFARPFLFFGQLKKFKPDLVMVTGETSLYLAALFKKFSKAVFIGIEHGLIPVSAFEKKMKIWACKQLDRMICVSHYTRRKGVEAGFISPQTLVIHNGADEKKFKKLPQSEYTRFLSGPQTKVLMTVGNVTERKGQETVIRALPEILKLFPGTHYWMAGLPTIKKPLEDLSKTLGVHEKVHFLGKISEEELVRRINAADVFLMTSRHASTGDFEGFGIAVVEAALCGKPSIVSENSGLLEAIVPNKTGFAVAEGDVKAVAGAVIKILSSDALKNEMGEQALKYALENQTWDQCVSKYENFFIRLTGKR